jgi:ABC-2 type transport system ATP-binding protein
LDEAQALADRVAIIKDGIVVAEGAPSEIGGENAHRVQVSWRDANGELQHRDTDAPTQLLNEITGEALAAGVELRELKVSRPSLEDVYLDLTSLEVDADV